MKVSRIVSEELPAIMLYYGITPNPHTSALIGAGFAGPDTTGFVAWNMHEWALR